MRVSEMPGRQACDGAGHTFLGSFRRRPVPQGQLHLGRAVDMTAPGAVEPTTQTAQPLEHPTTDPWEDVADRVRRRWPALSLPGCWGAVLLVCASLTPSLLPREGVAQGVVSGISAAMGYGLGVLAAAVWRALADRGPRPPRRWAWRVFLAAAAVLVTVFFFLGRRWQGALRELMGMPAEPLGPALLAPVVALVLQPHFIGGAASDVVAAAGPGLVSAAPV
jgi:uncharacterized membrane protein